MEEFDYINIEEGVDEENQPLAVKNFELNK